MSAWPDWLWWSLGGVLAALGLVLLGWSLCADRARGRRRCPRCWYDMSGTLGLTCSECGHQAKRERKLFRTRRGWRWAAIGLILLTAGYLSVAEPRRRSGESWPGYLLPNTVLLAAQPFLNDSQSTWFHELAHRSGNLWRWQRVLAARLYQRTLDDPVAHADLRFDAANALRVMGTYGGADDIVYPIMLQALKDRDPKIRARVSWGVASSANDSRARALALIELAHDPDADVRREVAGCLGEFGKDEQLVSPVLQTLLQDESRGARFYAAWALRRLHGSSPQISAVLLEAIHSSPDEDELYDFTYHIGRDGPALAMPLMIEAINSRNTLACAMAIDTLSYWGTQGAEAAPHVIRRLEDVTFPNRLEAFQTLNELGLSDASLVPLLKRLRDDPNASISGRARRALERIEAADERNPGVTTQ